MGVGWGWGSVSEKEKNNSDSHLGEGVSLFQFRLVPIINCRELAENSHAISSLDV